MLCPSGGKAGAPTIETDHQFQVITEALFKKNKKTCQVGVEFDMDTMEGFRIRRQVSYIQNCGGLVLIICQVMTWADSNQGPAEDELLYRTRVCYSHTPHYVFSHFVFQVPQADLFSNQAQLHGTIIMQLKKKWPCQQHRGEHGEDGHCYVNANREHIGLNNRKVKIWAWSIVSAQSVFLVYLSLVLTLFLCSP
jgi:hypothetical protein